MSRLLTTDVPEAPAGPAEQCFEITWAFLSIQRYAKNGLIVFLFGIPL